MDKIDISSEDIKETEASKNFTEYVIAAEREAESILDEKYTVKSGYQMMFYNRFALDYEKRNGFKPYSINDPKVKKEYNDWLRKQSSLFNIYVDCLRRFKWAPRKMPTDSNYYLELFKGDLDTLKKVFPQHVTVLSNYGSTIDPIKAQDSTLRNIDIHVRGGLPSFKVDAFGDTVYLPLDPHKINTLYVHNPYNLLEERKIKSLIHNNDLSVVYGIYSLASDPQLEYKLIELSKLYTELLKDNQTTKIYLSGIESRSDIGEYQIGLIYKPRKENRDN